MDTGRAGALRGMLAAMAVAVLVAAGCASSNETSTGAVAPAALTPTTPPELVPTPEPEPTPEPAPDTYQIATLTEIFTDTTRPTNFVADIVDAADERSLPTLVTYPADGAGPFPLIVFSHGLTGRAADLRPFTIRLAEAGYVVAAPDFPETTGGPDFRALGNYVHQPADVSFVIDEMVSTSELADLIDPERIGVAGHSLGAITTLGLVFNSCCRDDRIDAAVSLSGMQLPYDGDFEFTGVPLLLVHGTDDSVVPYAGSSAVFDATETDTWFLSWLDGNHGGYFDEASRAHEPIVGAVVDFFDLQLNDDDDAGADLEADSVVETVTELTISP